MAAFSRVKQRCPGVLLLHLMVSYVLPVLAASRLPDLAPPASARSFCQLNLQPSATRPGTPAAFLIFTPLLSIRIPTRPLPRRVEGIGLHRSTQQLPRSPLTISRTATPIQQLPRSPLTVSRIARLPRLDSRRFGPFDGDERVIDYRRRRTRPHSVRRTADRPAQGAILCG
jgi:hypothetical protein